MRIRLEELREAVVQTRLEERREVEMQTRPVAHREVMVQIPKMMVHREQPVQILMEKHRTVQNRATVILMSNWQTC